MKCGGQGGDGVGRMGEGGAGEFKHHWLQVSQILSLRHVSHYHCFPVLILASLSALEVTQSPSAILDMSHSFSIKKNSSFSHQIYLLSSLKDLDLRVIGPDFPGAGQVLIPERVTVSRGLYRSLVCRKSLKNSHG